MMFGFAVVTLVPSHVKEHELVPKVESICNYLMTFTEQFGERREYRVFPIDGGMAYRSWMGDRGKGARRRGRPNPHAAVYVMDQPLSNGHLSSVLWSVFDDLIATSFCKENFQSADYQLSHPVVGIQTVPQKTQADLLENVEPGENELGIYDRDNEKRKLELDREDVRMSIQEAYSHQKTVVDSTAKTTGYGRYGSNPYSGVPTYARVFMPGSNHEIVPLPPAVHNPLIADIMKITGDNVASVLGIPSSILSGEGSQHAANAELTMRMFDKTIKYVQQFLEPILQDLYDQAYKETHANFRKQVVDEIRDSKERERRRAQTAGQFDEYIRSTGEPSQARLPPKKRTKGHEIKASKVLGHDVTTGSDGNAQKRKFGMSKAPVLLDDERLEQLIADDVRFKLSFGRTPLTDTAALHDAFDVSNIIPYDEFARAMAGVIGIPENRILTEEEHYAQIEKKSKIESELMDKYTPDPPPQPAAPKGKGGAAPKPAQPGAPPNTIGVAFGGGAAKPGGSKGGGGPRGSGQLSKSRK